MRIQTSHGQLRVSTHDFFTALGFRVKSDTSFYEFHAYANQSKQQVGIYLGRQQIQVGTKSLTYAYHQIAKVEGEIYIDIELLSELFPFKFSIDYRKAQLDVSTLFHFPKLEAMIAARQEERPPPPEINQEKRDHFLTDVEITGDVDTAVKPVESKELPTLAPELETASEDLEPEYLLLELQIEDLVYDDLIDGYRNEAGKIFFSLDQMAQALSMAITTSPESRTAEGWAFNEDNTFSLDLKTSQFDTTQIVGDDLPGWEVEVYNNGTLIDFVLVGEDRRYTFNNIPLYYGNNIVKLVLYGPQGERREKTETYLTDSAIIPPGTFNYRFAGNDINKRLFDANGTNDNQDDKLHAMGMFEYGLSNNFTVNYGLLYSELEVEDDQIEPRYFQSLGVTSNLDNVITNLNTTYDFSTGGWAADVTLHTNFFGIFSCFKHEMFHNFACELNENSSDKEESVTSLNVNGNLSTPFFTRLNYNIEAELERFESGKKERLSIHVSVRLLLV